MVHKGRKDNPKGTNDTQKGKQHPRGSNDNQSAHDAFDDGISLKFHRKQGKKVTVDSFNTFFI